MGSSAFSHSLEFPRGLKEQVAKITIESQLRIKKKKKNHSSEWKVVSTGIGFEILK